MKVQAAITVLSCCLLACDDDPFAAGSARAYQSVATGGEHTCAVSEDGSAYCWGRGLDGELGIGVKENRGRPTRVPGTFDFAQITAGDAHTCALAVNGAGFCWGSNADGQRGNPSDLREAEPVPLLTQVRFHSISAGGRHTCALSLELFAYCWGANSFGQLGNGTTGNASVPTPVSGAIKFVQLSSGGEHTCGITADGRAYCWGRNQYGQLGNGSANLSAAPVQVTSSVSLAQISAGVAHTCATAVNGQFYCWGSDVFGELGVGAAYDGMPGAALPLAVSGQFPLLGMGASVHAGVYQTCAIAQDRTGRCWGRGEFGQIGNGRLEDQYFPQPLFLQPQYLHFGDLFTPTALAAGGATHICALAERSVFCWGMGTSGQLGVPGSSYAPLPQRVGD
jgi:alpha-tubulin suppressor-like RCC1 family protein